MTARSLCLLALGLTVSVSSALAADEQAVAMDLLHTAAQLSGALNACPFGADEKIAARSTAVMNSTVQRVVAAGARSGKDALAAEYALEFDANKAAQTKQPKNCDALLGKFGSLEQRAGTR